MRYRVLINFNEINLRKGEMFIMKQSVTFPNAGLTMAANLYLPENFDDTQTYSGIVVVHPGGGVKEQTAAIYAERLANNGFVAVAFDASCQGDSEGNTRGLEDPYARVEDIRTAVDYLTTLSCVDNNKIGALGICAGGGYVVNAAQTERRIKAVATVSAVDLGAMYRGEASIEEQLQVLEAVGQQRTAESNGAEVQFANWAPNSEGELTEETPVLLKEAYDYYRTPRAQHPNSDNKLPFAASLARIYSFSASAQLSDYLTQPLLLVIGKEADTRGYSDRFFELSNRPKELVEVEGGTHISMYDIPEHVDQAEAKIIPFFNENL